MCFLWYNKISICKKEIIYCINMIRRNRNMDNGITSYYNIDSNQEIMVRHVWLLFDFTKNG